MLDQKIVDQMVLAASCVRSKNREEAMDCLVTKQLHVSHCDRFHGKIDLAESQIFPLDDGVGSVLHGPLRTPGAIAMHRVRNNWCARGVLSVRMHTPNCIVGQTTRAPWVSWRTAVVCGTPGTR